MSGRQTHSWASPASTSSPLRTEPPRCHHHWSSWRWEGSYLRNIEKIFFFFMLNNQTYLSNTWPHVQCIGRHDRPKPLWVCGHKKSLCPAKERRTLKIVPWTFSAGQFNLRGGPGKIATAQVNLKQYHLWSGYICGAPIVQRLCWQTGSTVKVYTSSVQCYNWAKWSVGTSNIKIDVYADWFR